MATNLKQRFQAVLRAFRAAPELALRYQTGVEGRPSSLAYQDFYAASSAVYACIRLRANSVARPILRVYRNVQGERQEVVDHSLTTLLNYINPFWTRTQLWRQTETDLCWHGNAFWALENLPNKPNEIWRMRPDWVEIVTDPVHYIKGYIYRVDGRDYAWSADEVIHFRYFNPLHEFWGLSPLAAARLAVEMGIDAVTYNRYFFQNYATPSLVLTTKDFISKEQADELLARWNEAVRGVKKAGRTAILHSGLEPKPLGVSQKDAEWLSSMKWALEDVARVYGVPAPLIGEEKAVYKNISEAEAALWRETIIPELLWFEEILNVELVPLFKEQGLYVAYDLSSIEALQEDVNQKMTRYAQCLDRGVLTINEVRRREHFGKDVPWGDEPWMPLNLMPVGAARATETDSLNILRLYQNKEIEDDMEKTLAVFFERESLLIAQSYVTSSIKRSAVPLSQRQLDYEWNKWRELESPLADAMQKQVEVSSKEAFDSVGAKALFDLKNVRAAEWAKKAAALLVKDITATTKRVVERIISAGVKEGQSAAQITDALMKSSVFSRERARLIARTETQRAYNQGNISGYEQSGVVEGKEWTGGVNCCDVCTENTLQGTIDLRATFASGDNYPPAHPNCRCRLVPIVKKT
jgi:HK97 family phage portal protein